MQTEQIVCHGCLSRVAANLTKCPYCGHSFVNHNPAGTLPVGTVLVERYTLDKCLALDGEGVSYAAVDAQTARRVLIKEYVPVTICAARTQSGQVVPRRDREVLFKTTRMDFVDLYRSLMAVGPADGLCRVYDLVEANNTAYAVQEQPATTTLAAYLRSRRVPLTQQEALLLLSPVVYAVEAMHRKGLLHRGISPETIHINSDGRAKLADFATRGLRTADSELRSQVFEGYAAPEQYSVAEFDGKYTDVYGLAAVFYRAMTGQTPPAADRRRMSDTLISPRNLVDTIPPFVSAALTRALRMVGTERMQTVPELLDALTAPTKQESGYHMSVRQKKYLLMTLAGLALIAVLSTIVILVSRKKPVHAASSSVSSLSSSSVAASVAPTMITVPSFVNEDYTAIQQNPEHMNNFLFSITEEFSSEFAAGRVTEQDPAAGSSIEPGSIIKLTVSRGAETVLMPTVVGYARVDAKAMLDAAGIGYIVLERANDGTYTQDYVVDCDVPAGTAIDPAQTKVTLFVAQAPATA
ncbi:MAG: PASTA domain-containing protein [Ruthenibacterium sp.]